MGAPPPEPGEPGDPPPARPRPPKPLVQPMGPFGTTLIELAVTAPVWSDDPNAVTQSPTTRAEGDTVAVFVNRVEAPVPTVVGPLIA